MTAAAPVSGFHADRDDPCDRCSHSYSYSHNHRRRGGCTWSGCDCPARPPDATEVDVSSAPKALTWLREELGTNGLAGMFRRGQTLVRTPRVGENGYVAPDSRDEDGEAQIVAVDATGLAARIDHAYQPFKVVGKKDEKRAVAALFPVEVARRAEVTLDLAPDLRALRGVTHTPMLRPDGTVLDCPGYDAATATLFLPAAGVSFPPVRDPSPAELRFARYILDTLICDFPFRTPSDRANFLGWLLTPVLRGLLPPPYPAGAAARTTPAPASPCWASCPASSTAGSCGRSSRVPRTSCVRPSRRSCCPPPLRS